MSKAIITLPHTVVIGAGPLILYPQVHRPFMKFMGKLYPRFASYDKADKGYSAFDAVSGQFIGCFAGLTLQSVRKNPWFAGHNGEFLKALLAGIHIEQYDRHNSVCDADNYGTLRLWQKLGLGAKIDARGKARSAAPDEGSNGLLCDLIAKAKPGYNEHRQRAAEIIERTDATTVLPTQRDFTGIAPIRAEVIL